MILSKADFLIIVILLMNFLDVTYIFNFSKLYISFRDFGQ